jgi:xylan 1,4-beta-xylosidase
MRVTALVLLIAMNATAQTSGIRTWCNPIDLNYQYNFEQLNEQISYRSAADPVFVPHNGEYYLFATISGGYWRSKDLIHWDYIVPSMWPMEDICAPAALSVDGTIYLYQSTFVPRPIFSTRKPETGQLEFFNRWMPVLPDQPEEKQGPWDPDFFYDPDTKRWFMYWGSSNTYPLWGIELDFAKGLTWIGKPKELLRLDPDRHGWERFGRDHRETIKPYVEGAHMTRHNGRYYLQYGAPGTEYNVYANGVWVGDDPLGPFTYAPYNPMSYKPGGFVIGAGHGSTFRDNHGNFWNSGTPWIGVNWRFERRLAMFPAGFNRDGDMFASTRFGDFPHYAPTKKWTSPDELFTGWMLLSYRKPVQSSSAAPGFPASNATDEDPRSFWVASKNSDDQWLTIDLGRPYDVRALQVNYSDHKNNIFKSDERVYTQFRISESRDGKSWNRIADLTGEKRDRPNAYIELPFPVKTRYLRYEHVYTAGPNLAISDFRIFGNGTGGRPPVPRNLKVRRDSDQRNAFVSWQPVPRAVGYNVRWGIAPDKLYQTYQRFHDQGSELEVRALTVGQDYWFAIESFDENGVSQLSAAVPLSSK